MGRLRLIPNPPTVTPEGTNPAFRQGASTALWHHNGFGAGAHFTLEVDPANEARMIVEPGISTRVWYFAGSGATGFTQAAIAAAESVRRGTTVSPASIDAAWLEGPQTGNGNVDQYGLRSDRPLAWAGPGGAPEIGRLLYNSRWSRQTSTINSEWAMFRRGDTYDYTTGIDDASYFGMRQGESPLHPVLHGAFGTGARPLFPRPYTRDAATGLPRHWVWQGMDFRGKHSYNAPLFSVMYADCNFTAPDKGLTSSGTNIEAITFYGTSFIDNTLSAPNGGRTTWTNSNNDGTDAHFVNRANGFLRWRCFYDRNGWSPTYNIDGLTFSGGEFGQPPSNFSHHCYDAAGSRDMTSVECVYARAPFDSLQCRPGLFASLIVDLEAPCGGLFGAGFLRLDNLANRVGNFSDTFAGFVEGTTSRKRYQKVGATGANSSSPLVRMSHRGENIYNPGETIRDTDTNATATFTDYATNVTQIRGNLNYLSRMLLMGYARLRVNRNEGNRASVINGAAEEGNGGVFKNIIAANAIDPAPGNFAAETGNPDSRFRKPTAPNFDTRMGNSEFANAYRYDNITIFNWGQSANDRNVPAVSQGNRDRVTIGAWADQEQGVSYPTNSAWGAIDYIRTRADRCLLAVNIWNYAQQLINRPIIGHAPGAMARFSPDPDGDGWRTDTPDSWLINGVRGDFPVDGDDCDLDGQLAYSYRTWRFDDMDFGLGGGWRLYGGLISCNTTQGNGTLDLRGAGQFWLTTSSADINVTADGGRLGIAGTVSQVRGSFNGRAELLIIPGGALTISTGDTITLTGGNVLCGADGQSGTASLTVQGTLAFVAAGGQLPRVREFRSGRYGLAAPAAGVTGQPRDPNLTFNVTLASGSTITIDRTGIASGVQVDLIVADSLTNAGATLPSGCTIVGGNTLRYVAP